MIFITVINFTFKGFLLVSCLTSVVNKTDIAAALDYSRTNPQTVFHSFSVLKVLLTTVPVDK